MAEYTTRAEHPLIAVITHWVHLITLVFLVFTGFYIHYPFWGLDFSHMRSIHLWSALFFVLTFGVRMVWAVAGGGSAAAGGNRRRRDFLWFMPEKGDVRLTWETVKYYLFLRKTHPRTAKYNPLQKMAYLVLVPATLLIGITGLQLWERTADRLVTLTYWMGGPIWVRTIHYGTMWVFILIAVIHIYLAMAETIFELPMMFAWKSREMRHGPKAEAEDETPTAPEQ